MSPDTILILSNIALIAGLLFQAVHLLLVVEHTAVLYADPNSTKRFNWWWWWMSITFATTALILAHKLQPS